MTLLPTTELEAVNNMLVTVGEAPVNTLEGSSLSEVTIARSILSDVSRAVQVNGLHCNTESNYPLPVDSDGHIIVPTNTLRVSADDGSNITLRGGKLYDLTNHTFVFTAPVTVSITFFLAFEDLPSHIKNYIAVSAARNFQKKVGSSETLDSFSEDDERVAKAELERGELALSPHNFLNCYTVRNITGRLSNPVRLR